MQYQSLFLEVAPGHKIHVKNICGNNRGIPVLMVHGMVSNGRVFYHESGKGLGSYLAQQGYDVYVADLRGQGLSRPAISRYSEHGQTETIAEDIPALIRFVQQRSGKKKLHVAAHSWGGVYVSSALARAPELIDSIYSCVYFGSKRAVKVRNLDRLVKIDVFWNLVGRSSNKLLGYVEGKGLRLGSDNETMKTHLQCLDWVNSTAWVDADDGFDYGEALRFHSLPPTWYIAAINDRSLGHRDDVQRFMEESGDHEARYTVLARDRGNALDYDHISMLTASQALMDHFPLVHVWLQRHEPTTKRGQQRATAAA